MRDYQGRVELLDGDGEPLQEVRVFLRYQESDRSGLGEWGGQIDPAEITPADWLATRSVRLPNGNTGNARVTRHHERDGAQSGWLVGSGDCPF